MIDLIIILVVLSFYAAIALYGSIFFISAVSFGYSGLSIVMPPVLWIFLLIGTITGFVVALKNAIKAARSI